LFFEQFVGPEDHWLAPDHFQENPRGLVAHRTSPTNIGLLLLSTLAAYDMGYLGLPELKVRLTNTLDNLQKLERFQGHFLNWYDTSNLAPLPPRYVSTVDSGNLACCLVALRQSCLDVPDISLPRRIRRQGFLDTLSILSEILAESVHAAPTPIRALQKCVDSMVTQLESLDDNPQSWSLLLNRFAEVEWQEVDKELTSLLNIQQLDPALLRSVRIWTDRARYQLFDMQRKLHLMMPWLTFLPDTPRLLQSPMAGPAVSAAWQELKGIFPLDNIPCKLIPGTCEAAEKQLVKLAELLQASPADPIEKEEAAQWCASFSHSLAEAAIEVGKLLTAFDELGRKMERLIREMDFKFLYNQKRGVFHIGYNVDRDARDENFYDLLASESRLASLIAIAKGDVPETHWLNLSRPLTRSRWGSVLLSWSGTMFEYLMPGLLVKQYPDTLLTQSMYNSIDRQIDFARQKGIPWGISESGYFRFDSAMNYQYRAFGVPGLGLKPGLGDELVISPYASLLALPFEPGEVMDNIAHLIRMQMLGDYGFYEAVDFTPKRLMMGEKRAIIRSFMIHHQGMIMVSLINTLLDKPMVRRFHTDPQVRSVELLLQEHLPSAIPAIDLPGEETAMARPIQPKKMAASWQVPSDTVYPWVHYLSNGQYGVMITNSGSGFSRWRDIDLTRWRADTTLDDWGTWIYIRDQESGELWSASPQPCNHPQINWKVNFSPNQTEFHSKFSNIDSDLQITVPPDDDVEVRRLRLTNYSPHTRRLAITSFGELVLGDQNNDRRHPAFNKLFIESEYYPQNHILMFSRRLREATEQPLFMAHAVVVEPDPSIVVKFESDREKFLKRGGSPRRPAALISGDGELSGSAGAVLDPIMSLQIQLEIEPHSTAEITFLTVAGSSSRQLSTLIARYQRPGQVADAFRRARIQSELQLHHLNLDSTKISRYQQLLSLLLYPHARLRAPSQILARNRLGQSSLWPFAVSGDFPILLVTVAVDEELELLRELLWAYQYWRLRGMKIDLVILNEKEISYDQAFHDKLLELLELTHTEQWLNQRAGIFVLQAGRLSQADLTLFASAARLVLHRETGNLDQILAREFIVDAWLPQFVPPRMQREVEPTPQLHRPSGLLYDNGWGGFDADGREFVIYLRPGEWTPAPWVNVISNPGFGFLVSEMGSCFSWAVNSGENRLSPWQNDPIRDLTGEALYLRDETTGYIWSPTPQPIPADEPYLVRHGAGYTIFEHHSHGLKQTLRVFADAAEPVKLVDLRLENTWSQPRVLTATYYCEWVLGVNRDQAQQYLIPEYDGETGALLATQPYQEEFGQGVAFLAACQHPDSLTADRAEFIGRLGELSNPAALGRVGLTGQVKAGTDPCAVLQIFVYLGAGETRNIHFVLGQGKHRTEALDLIRRFKDPHYLEIAWQAVLEQWDDRLGVVQVETPDKQMDLMLNRWLLYQTLSCRIWGRSGYYQSSGAYGFRDQLQDGMGVLHVAPEEARQLILRAAGRQFEEGDVLHWWHPPSGRGVRTRVSDDLLWLPYVTAEYLVFTQDETILYEALPFLQAPPLADDEIERYSDFKPADEPVNLYEHCCRAITRADRCGVHGLPLIGSGD
ncbi:MAG TPA: glucoamylase family protein, partial [Anaerolineales bacterium]|nr:glucoamylase family protein [Anaerolineales bacterium]